MAERGDSENLRDLEGHAEEQGEALRASGGEKPEDPDEVSRATESMDAGGDAGEHMRPEGEAPDRIEGETELKRIDEDVEGGEETKDMGDVEAGDAEAPSS